ncbi:uncharacterized protein LOC121397767 [Xenopus laevis]|uniref:Uncharacterized protein LOC121397767 n=1 Tax=Xenopus laevis TaxID=8355 RepID=A0A8J1LNJ2_XENLA|nr:uncharacterized protein LOC121397767 [Xenopus laevis]
MPPLRNEWMNFVRRIEELLIGVRKHTVYCTGILIVSACPEETPTPRWPDVFHKHPLIHSRIHGGFYDGELARSCCSKASQTMPLPPPCFKREDKIYEDSPVTHRLILAFLHVSPLSFCTGNLKEYFSQYGVVKRCLLAFDKTGFHRGYCWVGFASEEGLQNTLQKDAHQLEGSKLQVLQNKRLLGNTNRHGLGES